ncbi:lipocalin family protein [Galbibacter sp. EGI 63066]|uniref:lipocalin family protein n=1 Tax=Galbibacter sp. EGI 63066 TaxID=2993559 RepID=UPI002248A7AC|nr:lipocalin family protein [Galbibacter sp. EGI 63066]MCX2679846.1 lipocalin family protein [Galbibacter sp. EGI 63066]
MTKITLTITILAAFTFLACNKTSKQTINAGGSNSETENITNLLIGSWVQLNPIDEKEVQGFTLKNDGTAESINMATLVYKKWWIEKGKFVLVAESIGSGSSSIDTTKYEIVNRTNSVLELKDGDYTDRYTKK